MTKFNYPRRNYDIDYTIEVPVLERDGSNRSDFFCADVLSGKEFARNYGGYPRSDLAQLREAASIDLQRELASRLVDYGDGGVQIPDGSSSADLDAAFLSLKSRYQQTPSEVVGYIENQLKVRDARVAASAAVESSVQVQDSSTNIDNV